MFAKNILVTGVVLLCAACASNPPAPVRADCSAAILEKSERNDKAAVDAAADLSALAKLPLKGNFKAEIARVFNTTFQKIPDQAAACAMLNQTYVCIADPARASEYMAFMKETKQCAK